MMLGKHKFYVGQRVRPSQEGIAASIFCGTYRGINRATAAGVVTDVDVFNSPTVLWNYRTTTSSYHPEWIMPDRRRRTPATEAEKGEER